MALPDVPEFETGISDTTELNQLGDAVIWTRDRHPYAKKSSDEIVSSSTALQNDDELVEAVEAGATYKVDFFILYEAGTAADYKWALTFPAGATLSILVHQWSTALAWAQAMSGSYTSGGAVAAGGNGIGTVIALSGVGILVVGGTAGNLQYQWAQNSSVAENTATKAGSSLDVTRLA